MGISKMGLGEFDEKVLFKGLDKVNAAMSKFLSSDNDKMREVMEWVLASKGKQLRPRLVLLSSHFGKGVDGKVIDFAAMLEIIHMASLVHDDVIDDAETRRGRLSVQQKFGKQMAVYAGDFMIFAVFSERTFIADPRLRQVYATMRSICSGELGQHDNLYNFDVSIDKYIDNISGKTAGMFKLACELGASVGHASQSTISRLGTFGKNLGILFQIQDDILDYRSEDKGVDKPVYQDFSNGIYTLPLLFAMTSPDLKARLVTIDSHTRGKPLPEQYRREIDNIIRAGDGFAKCLQAAEPFRREALNALSGLRDCVEKDYLASLLNEVCARIDISYRP